jgi:50S ribosomal protein L16 3-hydroxylase
LDLRTQLLYDAHHLFVNGTALPWPVDRAAALLRLANRRALTPRDATALPTAIAELLYDWYCDGFLVPDNA